VRKSIVSLFSIDVSIEVIKNCLLALGNGAIAIHAIMPKNILVTESMWASKSNLSSSAYQPYHFG
jgi:hypothetical protein